MIRLTGQIRRLFLQKSTDMKSTDNRDSVDFGEVEVHKLFRILFFPTLLGMLFNVAFILTDGIFVGRGVGPEGLAGVNLVSPVMMFITGIGMMFGIGSSVVAAIHLSKDNVKAARINITQGLLASVVLSLIFSAVLYACPDTVLKLLGTSEDLLPMAREYLFWFVPTCILIMIQIVGEFGIRLDGSPKYAMYCAIVPSVLNIILDYVFIFPLGWGIKGAAIATDIGTGVGACVSLWYFVGPAVKLRLYRLKLSRTSLLLSLRNVGYMVKVGFSGFIGEFAGSVMALCGNLAFGRLLGDEGIAAFSVACYLVPIVYNVFYAVSSSAQPIISFNFGSGKMDRASGTFRYGTGISVIFALAVTVLMWLFAPTVISIFLDRTTGSFAFAAEGLPLFALGFVLSGFNYCTIGYFQSLERNFISTFLMSLRGILLPIVMFLLLPRLFGAPGLWLAMPAAELICSAAAAFFLRRQRVSLI